MKLRLLWDDLRGALWFRPALWVVALGMAAILLVAVDERLTSARLYELLPWLRVEGVEGTRTMLGAISSAMLTVTTLAFSILMVAVVQTANAYSPRVLRQYFSDTSQQHVLGILTGTFLYSLIVLRGVRTTGEANFIPSLAVSGALLLTVLSIAAFIYFIHHVAHSIEVSAVVRSLHRETALLFEDCFPRGVGQPCASGPALPDDAPGLIRSEHTGYLEAIDGQALLEAARQANALLRLEPLVGDYLLAGIPVAHVWPPAAAEALHGPVLKALTLGVERTLVQDLHFGLRQLADIALRALSPGINDPTTAINCVDVLGALLAPMAQRPTPSPFRCDSAGRLRLVAHGPTFASALNVSFNPIRQYALSDLSVTVRLIELLGQLGELAEEPGDQQALWQHLGIMARSADRGLPEPLDRAEVNRQLRRAAHRLHRPADPILLSETAAE